MTLELSTCLYVSAAIFSLGVYGILSRKNTLVILMSLEVMLNAVNLAILAFARAHLPERPADPSLSTVFVLMVLAVAAAEAAVGLSILLAVFRRSRTTHTDDINLLRG